MINEPLISSCSESTSGRSLEQRTSTNKQTKNGFARRKRIICIEKFRVLQTNGGGGRRELLIRFGTKAVGYMVTFLLVNARYYSIFLVYPILFVCVLEVESPGSHCPISRPGVLPVRQPASIYSGGMPSRLASVSILFLINKLKCPCVATGDKCVNVFSSWSSFCLTTLLRMRAFCSCIPRNHRRPANITHDKYTAYLLCCHPRFQNVPNSYLCVHRMSKHIFCFVLFFIWCCKFIHLQPFLADYYSFNIFIW